MFLREGVDLRSLQRTEQESVTRDTNVVKAYICAATNGASDATAKMNLVNMTWLCTRRFSGISASEKRKTYRLKSSGESYANSSPLYPQHSMPAVNDNPSSTALTSTASSAHELALARRRWPFSFIDGEQDLHVQYQIRGMKGSVVGGELEFRADKSA